MCRFFVLALLAGCLTGTTTPGLKRCVKLFVVIGFYSACEEGPGWQRGVDPYAPPPAAQPPQPTKQDTPRKLPSGSFCFFMVPAPNEHAIPVCAATMDDCRRAAHEVAAPAEITIDCAAK